MLLYKELRLQPIIKMGDTKIKASVEVNENLTLWDLEKVSNLQEAMPKSVIENTLFGDHPTEESRYFPYWDINGLYGRLDSIVQDSASFSPQVLLYKRSDASNHYQNEEHKD